jgi:hypothetical protein
MGAVCAKSSTRKMKALFRRSRPYFKNHLPYGLTEELELLPGLTTENIWASGVTWEEFHRFLRDKLVWMTTNVYVCSNGFCVRGAPRVLQLGGNGYTNMFVYVRSGAAAAEAVATCNFLVRLLASSELSSVLIQGRHNEVPLPLSGAGLSIFFQESRDSLRKVAFHDMALNEDLCRALATMPQLDVELEMRYCSLADDATGAFVECLHSDRGPITLNQCDIDDQILASALTGNSRVTKLKLLDSGRANNADTAVLFATLANNRGLVDLDWEDRSSSDDNWTILCESLQAHPSLTKLDLSHTGGRGNGLTGDQKVQRTRLLAEMVQHNTVLHTINLSEYERDEKIYTESILPYLKTNRYRSWVHAIKKADISLRRPLLGRALQTESVRNDSNLLWMFLSGNADVVVRPN